MKKVNRSTDIRAGSRYLVTCLFVILFGGMNVWAQSTPLESSAEAYTRPAPAAANQAKILIYRAQALTPQSPAHVYLNGQYHASLLKGGFTEFCVESGRAFIHVTINDLARQTTGKTLLGQIYEMPRGRTLFVRVRESAPGQTHIQYVTATEAEQEIRVTRRQPHMTSHAAVVRACGVTQEPTTLQQQSESQKVSMQTDTLFEFGKAELRVSGHATLDKWIQQFNAEYSVLEQVKVLGYTDAIGPVQLNSVLSQRRAQVVRDYLSTHGLKPKSGIEFEGRGALELAKTGCANLPTPENKDCHTPNRRVVMVIMGTKK